MSGEFENKNTINSLCWEEVDGTCCTSPGSVTMYRLILGTVVVTIMIRITTMKNIQYGVITVYSTMQEFLFPTLFLMSDDVIISLSSPSFRSFPQASPSMPSKWPSFNPQCTLSIWRANTSWSSFNDSGGSLVISWMAERRDKQATEVDFRNVMLT